MMQKWVNGWGLGVAHPPLTETQWTKNITVRYVIQNTLNADKVKLRFTNRFGENEAELSKVTVAISADGKDRVLPQTVTPVTFGGMQRGVMAPHGDIVSDEIPFSVKCGDKIAVSIYFEKFTQMNTGFTYDNKFFVRRFIEGEYTGAECFDPLQMSFSSSYHFLWSMDFLCSEDSYAVAAYGDSLTSQEWVDLLAQKLAAEGRGNRAIVRRAVSGSRIFGSYPAVSYYHYGEDGKTRFEREVLHDGVKKVIIFHGINDIIHPDGKNPLRPMSNMPTPEQLAEGLLWYHERAKAAGLETYFATLLPIFGWRTYDVPRDDIRRAFNVWIRSQHISDGVIDFEKAVRDAHNERAFAEECDRGDHLHAALEGYRRMAEAVDWSIFD